jgi:hypothetical protein
LALVLSKAVIYPFPQMDLSKYPLDKLLYFVAGIIPGSAAIWIYTVARPGTVQWFFNSGFVGYRTHMIVLVFAAFVIGHTITSCINSILGAVGFVIGYFIGSRSSVKFGFAFLVAPWRDTRWRAAAAKYLGIAAPPDTQLISPQLAEIRTSSFSYLPDAEKATADFNLVTEQIRSIDEDRQWQQWYMQFHRTVLAPNDSDVVVHVRNGLHSNAQAAAIYTVIAFYFVPLAIHWWSVLLALAWIFLLLIEVTDGFIRHGDIWSTLSAQIEYLSANQKA